MGDPDDHVDAGEGLPGTPDDVAALLTILPAPVYEDCLAASQVDPDVLAEDAEIVRRTWGPVQSLSALGPTEVAALTDLDLGRLDRLRQQIELVHAMAVLSDSLAACEGPAVQESNDLLARVRAERRSATSRRRADAEQRLKETAHAVRAARAKVADLERRARHLPKPELIAHELERMKAENEIFMVDLELPLAQATLRSNEAQLELFETLAGPASDAADDLTDLFHVGWTGVGSDLMSLRGARVAQVKRRRWWRVGRGALGLIGSVLLAWAIGQITDRLLGVVAGIVVALGYAVVEKRIIDPFLNRRDLQTRSRDMCIEMMLCGVFWVLIRNHEACLNSYARSSEQPPIALVPESLRPTPDSRVQAEVAGQ